jgi:hypothetical protein
LALVGIVHAVATAHADSSPLVILAKLGCFNVLSQILALLD